LGRTHFYPEFSVAWHQQIERALTVMPTEAKRLAVKRGIYKELQERRTKTAGVKQTDD